MKEGTDCEESVRPRWQLEASRHHTRDCEILVERLPTQRCATDLKPNLGQLRFAGIAQTAESIRRKSHSPTRAISFAHALRDVSCEWGFARVSQQPAATGPSRACPSCVASPRLAMLPFVQRRDGGPELVIRGKHPVVAVPMLARWRDQKPVRR